MGWYINHLSDGTYLANIGKADSLIAHGDAIAIIQPSDVDSVDDGLAILCVVSNGLFEAVGYAFDNRELAEFSRDDGRSKQWLSMSKALCERLTGYDLVYKKEK